ncbi:MAG TPA: TatD family hydrolase [Chitinophagaceae bacterium]|nr:TatD family hydrolase [Chitinophagaceae bacterium]
MHFIDTHCHLYLPEFDNDLETVMDRAQNEGIEKFYMPAIDHRETDRLLKTESAYPEKCFAMMGLHPCSVKENYEEELRLVEDWFEKRRFAAVGEIGLDYYWDLTFKKEQIISFQKQIELAIRKNRPIVIHSRESLDDCIDIVKSFQGKVRGIFHCFGGTMDQAKAIIDLGLYLGIGGVLTYKKSGLDLVMKEISLDHVVLETDAPYLSPVPFRGKRNESSYLIHVANKLAEIKQIDIAEVADITTKNAMHVFE